MSWQESLQHIADLKTEWNGYFLPVIPPEVVAHCRWLCEQLPAPDELKAAAHDVIQMRWNLHGNVCLELSVEMKRLGWTWIPQTETVKNGWLLWKWVKEESVEQLAEYLVART